MVDTIKTVTVAEDNFRHILLPVRKGLLTLCGFTDAVWAEPATGKPDCPDCLELLRWCRTARYEKSPLS